MMSFIKLPKQLFYPIEGVSDTSILKQVNDDKVFLVLEYLYNHVDRRDMIQFTIDRMVTECGYKPDSHKGKVNDCFINILFNLQELNIFSFQNKNKDEKIKSTELVIGKLNLEMKNTYVELQDSEKEKIIKQKLHNVDSLKLLIYYCYLKSRIYKRAKGDNMQVSGGRAEVCWVTYEAINRDLGLTDETIKLYNDLLVKLDLIRIGYAGNWYYNTDPKKFLRESCNFYALYTTEEDAALQLKEGIKAYKALDINANKVFTDSKKYKNNNRQLNGKLAAIIKKEKHGKATEEDIKKKNELLASINVDAESQKIISLLDKRKSDEGREVLLSDIYGDMGKEELADKYSQLEDSLGVTVDYKLVIDWDYYKWVISNYTEDKHDYFVNCVKKHKGKKDICITNDPSTEEQDEMEKGCREMEQKQEKIRNIDWGTKDTLKSIKNDEDSPIIEDKVVVVKVKPFGGFYENIGKSNVAEI